MKVRRSERFELPRASRYSHHWLERLRADFRLAIVITFGLCTMLAIAPFAVFRFVTLDYATGFVDLMLVAGAGLLVTYAWCGSKSERAGTVMTLFMAAGYVINVTVGSAGYFWAYPLLAASFLIAQRWFALGIGAVVIIIVAAQPKQFESVFDNWSFVITAALVAVFGLIFATRTQTQQRALEQVASRDPLTEAGNRRMLRRVLDQILRQRDRHGSNAVIITIDLDHFKEVNDRFGHEAGDRVLVDLVALLCDELREQDSVFRVGGEEFVVLLPGTDVDGGATVADKLQQVIRQHLLGPAGPITVSMGVATLRPNEAAHEWLARADKALYRAKKRGRNCIASAESS